MAVRRGISRGLQAASNSVGDMISRMLDEDAAERQGRRTLARQLMLEDIQNRNSFSRLMAGDRTLADRMVSAGGRGLPAGLDASPFGSNNQDRMRAITESINKGTNETNILGDEALKAAFASEGLTDAPSIQQLMAQRQERENQVRAQIQAAEDAKNRVVGGVEGFFGREGAFIPTERTGIEEGERALATAEAGELSPEMTGLKSAQANAIETATRGGKAATAQAVSRGNAFGQIQGRSDNRQNLFEVEGELARLRQQAQQGASSTGQVSPALLMSGEKMIALSSALNTADDTGPGATLGGFRQTANKFLRLDANEAQWARQLDDMVEGFTPMVARMAGHSGVLTQQDVDSVKRITPGRGLSRTESAQRNAMFWRFVEALQRRLEQGATTGNKVQPGEVAAIVDAISGAGGPGVGGLGATIDPATGDLIIGN